MSTEIRLSAAELFLAANLGALRHVEALRARRPDSFGAEKDNGWQLHIEGVCGEMATAKALGCYFGATLNSFKKGGDLLADIQVRTRSRPDYELIVRESDRMGDRFVLVTGSAPVYVVRGWCFGHEAKRQEWRQAYGGRTPSFFVPTAALHPIEELLRAQAPPPPPPQSPVDVMASEIKW